VRGPGVGPRGDRARTSRTRITDCWARRTVPLPGPMSRPGPMSPEWRATASMTPDVRRGFMPPDSCLPIVDAYETAENSSLSAFR
jgi:hypothetical protein